jgi:O-antigen ligase
VLALVAALGLALAWLPWEWAAVLIVGCAAALVLLVRPELTLVLLAFAVPFGSIRELPLGPVNVGAADLLVGILLAAWLARMIAARRIVIPRAPLLVPLLVFLGAISFSTLASVSLELSAKEIVKWVEVLTIYLFMASLNPPEVPQPTGGLNWTVLALLAAGSAEALVGVYQFLFRVGPEGFVLFGRFMRAYGHFAQPNPFAGYLGLGIPLAYALTLEGLQVWPQLAAQARSGLRQALVQAFQYAAALVALGIMSVAMLMSWSRGAWVGLAAALVVVTVVRSRRALALAVALGLVLSYVLLIGGARHLPPALVQRVSDFLPYVGGVDVRSVQVTDANFAVVERMAHWLAAVGMFSDHPWLGVGIGNYPEAYSRYAIGRWRDPLGHAHNYYLNIAAEAGVVGLLAYLLLFGACLFYAWRVAQHARGFGRALALGALGVLVHLSVHNLFDNLFVHSMNVQVGLVLGLLATADATAGAHDAHRD